MRLSKGIVLCVILSREFMSKKKEDDEELNKEKEEQKKAISKKMRGKGRNRNDYKPRKGTRK